MSYKLNSGVCSSLAKAMIGNKHLVTKVVLDGNGLDDVAMSVLLQGLLT